MYKEYQEKQGQRTISAERFVKGMENGWRIYYARSAGKPLTNLVDLRTEEECKSFIESHPKFKFEKPIPLLIPEHAKKDNGLEMSFGDYILPSGFVLNKEKFENLFEA